MQHSHVIYSPIPTSPYCRHPYPDEVTYFRDNYPGLSDATYNLRPSPETYVVAVVGSEGMNQWLSRPILLTQRHMGWARDVSDIAQAEFDLRLEIESFMLKYEIMADLTGSTAYANHYYWHLSPDYYHGGRILLQLNNLNRNAAIILKRYASESRISRV